MKTIKLSELFDIDKPSTLIYSNCIPDDNGINYVSSKGENNGIVGKVQIIPNRKIYGAGCITVPLKGTVLEAHVQPEKCYVAHQIAVLIPKKEMNIKEEIYYCMCIKANKFKYSYGRQADSTISDLLVPEEVPDWVYKIEEPNLSKYKESFNNSPTPELNINNWKEFKYTDIFDTIMIGKSIDLNKLEEGDINYIGRTEENNGITAKVSKYNNQEPYEGNCITVPMVGNALKSTYQNSPFYVSQNILILRNRDLNKYNAMFFNAIIRMDKFRFCYGRTLSIDRFKQLTIKLPATPEGEPDYQFMEGYIKTLPYSKYI